MNAAKKTIVAPDSFKGCFRAAEAAAIIASAIKEKHPEWTVVELPLADGGEGTVGAVLAATGGRLCTARVSDPLGRPVDAEYGIFGDSAVIEVSAACGLKRLSEAEKNPLAASSYGVGELLIDAAARGCRHILLGLGDTATCDGGSGMMSAPGLREALRDCSIELLCDVDNPFVGPDGAALIFAPQKGASPRDVEILEKRMEAYAAEILAETGTDVRTLPGAGAAGGIGGALMAYFNAKAVSGIDRILDLLDFDSILEGADLIITGEGRSDLQTLSGKVPMGVLRRSKGIPLVLLSGRITNKETLLEAGFSKLVQVSPDSLPTEEALRPEIAAANLRKAVAENL